MLYYYQLIEVTRMTSQPAQVAETPVERVQLGVRMEKRMVKVLKGLAEFQNVSLGQLLENIVLHSFEPMPGERLELLTFRPVPLTARG